MSEPSIRQTAGPTFHANVLEQINDAVIAVDTAERITHFNAAASRLYGVSSERALGQSLRLIVGYRFADEATERAVLGALEATGFWRGENIHTRLDGTRLLVESTVSVLKDELGSPAGMLAVIRDVTDRRRIEQRNLFLQSLSDRLRDMTDPRSIMEAAAELLGRHLGVGRCGYGEMDASALVVRVERDWTDGSMPSAAGIYHLRSYGPALVDDLRAGHTVRVDDPSADPRMNSDEASAHLALGGMRASIVLPLVKRGQFAALLYVHQNTARHWTDDDEAIVREVAERTWAAVERARAESAVRESDRRFSLMADAAPVLVWIADVTTECIWFNKPYLEFTGRTMSEEVSQGWLENIHADDLPRCVAIYRGSFERREAFSMDYRLRRRDGHYRWIVGQGQPLFEGPAGSFSGFIGSCIDITDRKRAEEALREADRRKDEFLATLAHELRNPLAPIRQAVRIARSPQVTEAQLRWSHEVIERQATHMSLLLGDLLDAARVTEGKLELRKERVELAAIIDTAIETARPLIDTRRQLLHVIVPRQPVYLHADALRLAQAMANLLTNAAKYSHSEGHIDLIASVEPGFAVLTVRDSGIGIEPHMLSRVFDMFSQATSALHRSEGGLGIGLAIVKGIVELHGGHVEARSLGLGRGSEFVLHLPHDMEISMDTPEETRSTPPARATTGLTIVIADDNRDSADSLKMLLELDGHTIHVANDGQEALDLVEQIRPRMALLDIGMPRLNGYEVATKIREKSWGREVRLVAFTGWGQSQDRERALSAGFDKHLTKPVDYDAVRSIVQQTEA